jgi:hypothetical protein
MKRADSLLIDYYENEEVADFFAFKQVLTDISPAASKIIAPFRKDLVEFFKWGEIGVFRDLHQAFAFISHLSLKDIGEDERLVETFIMHDFGLPLPDVTLTRELNVVLREALQEFRVTGLPRHGPGSTADAGRYSLFEKYLHVGKDQLLSYVLKKNGYDPDDFIVGPDIPWERCAVMRTVPKSALTKRAICMEPVTNQFYQQMVRASLYAYFEHNVEIRKHIHLRDQTRNREYARVGSIAGYYATIDLSSASDSVSWVLARMAFKGTSLLPWMYATRSRYVEINGSRMLSKKYAPMGSALCFPIMCLVFYAICKNVQRKLGHQKQVSDFLVYGDDIVCTSNMVDDVLDALSRLGFTVNYGKTFTRVTANVFRESCGGEYLGGYDVSPLRISRKYEAGELTPDRPDQIRCHVDLANLCYDRGYLRCRSWLISGLIKLAPDFRPLFGSGRGRIKTADPTNYDHWRRFHKGYQRLEYRALTTCITRDPIDAPAEFDASHRLRIPESATVLDQQASLREEVRYLHYWLSTLSVSASREAVWDSWWDEINQLLSTRSNGRTEIGKITSVTGNRGWQPAIIL